MEGFVLYVIWSKEYHPYLTYTRVLVSKGLVTLERNGIRFGFNISNDSNVTPPVRSVKNLQFN